MHFEIPADDMKRAKKFYASVFGWKLTDVPEMSYVIVTTVDSNEKGAPKEPGAINGGMMMRDKTAKAPVVVVGVKSVDDTIKKTTRGDGKVVMKKTKVGDMGFYARVTDSEGNVIGIWQ